MQGPGNDGSDEMTERGTSGVAESMGPVGLWTHALDPQPIARSRELAAELDELGFGSILVPEMAGRDPLVFADQLLDAIG